MHVLYYRWLNQPDLSEINIFQKKKFFFEIEIVVLVT